MQLSKSKVFFGVVLGSLIFSFFISRHSKAEDNANLSFLAMPYVVEEQDNNSNKISEKSGLSEQTNPRAIAEGLGFIVYPEDQISNFPEIDMKIGSKITLRRAPVYFIKDGKKRYEFRSWQKTVGDLLQEKKIELGLEDKINFSQDTELENRLEIVITRVAKTIVVEKESIDYKTTKKPNPNLEKGNKNVLQKGAKGTKNKYYLVIREDGEEVSKTFQRSEIEKEPIDEVLEVGTKVVTYGNGTATWYKRNQTMVAAHNSLPKGTRVRVVNLANGKSVVVTIDDRGIQTNAIIDLSSDAFAAIADLGTGVINVKVEKYYPDE